MRSLLILVAISVSGAFAQTVDNSDAAKTIPFKVRDAEPGRCSYGEIYLNSTTNSLRLCVATNTWADPKGANGAVSTSSLGVKCDGSTDDRAALQAAINANVGKAIVLPDGATCLMTPTADKTRFLTIPAGTILRGHATLKVANGSAPYDNVLYQPTDCSNCDIQEITIDSNIANNPIVNLQEYTVAVHQRRELAIFGGSPITVKNITIKNSSSVNGIDLNGPTVGALLIADNQWINIGDDPNHVSHDYSAIYTNAIGPQIIHGNRFTASAIAAPAAYTAIETHGNGITVTGNSILNFVNGVNATGIEAGGDAWANVVSGNVVVGAMICIELWSSTSGGHVSGYGMNGVVVEGNSCRLNQFSYVGATIWGGSTATWGILIDPNANMAVANIKIANNVIVFDPETTTRTANSGSFGIGWYSVNSQNAENLSIEDNTIDNAPINGIRVIAGTITGMKITGNTIRNAGSSLDTLVDIGNKVPIYLSAAVGQMQGECSRNHISDTWATTRIQRPWVLQGQSNALNNLQMLDNIITVTGDQASWTGYFQGMGDDNLKPYVRMMAVSPAFTIPAHSMRNGSSVYDQSTGITYRLPADGIVWSRGPRVAFVATPASDLVCAHGGDTTIAALTCNNTAGTEASTAAVAFNTVFAVPASIWYTGKALRITGNFAHWSTATAPGITRTAVFFGATLAADHAGTTSITVSQAGGGSSATWLATGTNGSGSIIVQPVAVNFPGATAGTTQNTSGEPVSAGQAAQNLSLQIKYAASGLFSGTYTSGVTATGTVGQTCVLNTFNNGNSSGTATVALTGTNTIAGGTALVITNTGFGSTSAATSATSANGTATCSGTATVATVTGGAQGNAIQLQSLLIEELN